VSPDEPPTTRTWPLENFVDVAPRIGSSRTTAGSISPIVRRRRESLARNADVDDAHVAGVLLARGDPEAGLCELEGHGGARAYRFRGDDTRGSVDAARYVDAHDLAPRRVDRRDRVRDRAPRLTLEARAEQRINDHRGVLGHGARELLRWIAGEPLEIGERIAGVLLRGRRAQHAYAPPGLAQDARRDEPVAAVVALPAHDRHRAVARHLLDRARYAEAGSLHQLERRHAHLIDRVAVDRAHLLGIRERAAPIRKGCHVRRS
jgi:hypothetical protein